MRAESPPIEVAGEGHIYGALSMAGYAQGFARAFIVNRELTTTVKKQPLCGVILHLRTPGTIPGRHPGYPDPLRGDFFDGGCVDSP